MKKSFRLILNALLLLFILSAPKFGQSHSIIPLESEITSFLNQHPLLTENLASVLEVYSLGEALVIDLSQEILPNGEYEEEIFDNPNPSSP